MELLATLIGVNIAGKTAWNGLSDLGNGISAAVINVTPQLAEVFLSRNHGGNRTIVLARVASKVADMQAGGWKLTHQGICFDAELDLIDGQHRLSAIVESGITVPMLVCINTNGNITDPVDRHASRTISYLTKISTRDVAACRVLIGLERGWPAPAQVTADQTTAVYERHFDTIKMLPECTRKFMAGTFAAIIWSSPIAKLEDLATFLGGVAIGEMIERGDPAFALREWLKRNARESPWNIAMASLNCVRAEIRKDRMRAVTVSEVGYQQITARRRVLNIANTPSAAVSRRT